MMRVDIFNHRSVCPSGTVPARRCHGGWTLVELLVVVGVVSTLALIALPSWQAQVHKVRRLEAVEALHQVSLAQERWRAANATYSSDLGHARGLALTAAPSATWFDTPSGHYRVSVQTQAATARQRHAVTATAQGAMANDAVCRSLSLVVDAGVTTPEATPAVNTQRCWGR